MRLSTNQPIFFFLFSSDVVSPKTLHLISISCFSPKPYHKFYDTSLRLNYCTSYSLCSISLKDGKETLKPFIYLQMLSHRSFVLLADQKIRSYTHARLNTFLHFLKIFPFFEPQLKHPQYNLLESLYQTCIP